MTFEHRGELRADPGSAPGDRNVVTRGKQSSIWPSIAVVAAAAAFGGVIWFAYRSGPNLPGSGQPPLVKAESGPVKVKPDHPTGEETPYQDTTVYDRLDQGSGQKPAAEKILPPPEAPIARPQPAVPPQAAVAGQGGVPDSLPPPNDSSPTALAPPPGAVTLPPAAPPPTVHQAAQAAPSRPQPAAPPAKLPRVAAVKPAPTPQSAVTKPATPPAAEHAKPKPQVDAIAALESRALASFPESRSSPTPAPAAAHKGGSFKVQLVSVQEQGAVSEHWKQLKQRFPELGGLSPSTARADIPGKGTYYRLQAGPLDEAGAKSMCDRLRAQGSACIVVKP